MQVHRNNENDISQCCQEHIVMPNLSATIPNVPVKTSLANHRATPLTFSCSIQHVQHKSIFQVTLFSVFHSHITNNIEKTIHIKLLHPPATSSPAHRASRVTSFIYFGSILLLLPHMHHNERTLTRSWIPFFPKITSITTTSSTISSGWLFLLLNEIRKLRAQTKKHITVTKKLYDKLRSLFSRASLTLHFCVPLLIFSWRGLLSNSPNECFTQAKAGSILYVFQFHGVRPKVPLVGGLLALLSLL